MGFKQPGDGSQDGEMSAGAVAGVQQKSQRAHLINGVRDYNQPIRTDPVEGTTPNAPTFLMRGFDAAAPWKVSRRQNLFKAIAARLGLRGSIWRGHVVRDAPTATAPRRTAGIGGATFAFLAFLVITICAGAVVALTQIKSLKAEIASLQRELFPLRERLAKFELAEKAKAREAEIKAAGETAKALAQNLSQQAAPLTFAREEIQLIREYIKPAPTAGAAAPTINVGDPVPGGTIPFPSPLTDKVPKLLGARFAILNGVILVVRKDSRQVDAVLPAH